MGAWVGLWYTYATTNRVLCHHCITSCDSRLGNDMEGPCGDALLYFKVGYGGGEQS